MKKEVHPKMAQSLWTLKTLIYSTMNKVIDQMMKMVSCLREADANLRRICSVLVKTIAKLSAIIVYSHLHMRDACIPERRVM